MAGLIKVGAILLFMLGLASFMLFGDFQMLMIFMICGAIAYIPIPTLKIGLGGIVAVALIINVIGTFMGIFSFTIPYLSFFGSLALLIGACVVAFYGYMESQGQA